LGPNWRHGRRDYFYGKYSIRWYQFSFFMRRYGSYGSGLPLAARLGSVWRPGRHGCFFGRCDTWSRPISFGAVDAAFDDIDILMRQEYYLILDILFIKWNYFCI
jgi:hypothetical protein